MNESQTESLSPESMPGLELAYGFVQPSYQWLVARFEAGNTRLQTLQAIVASVSLAVPAFAKLLDPAISFAGPPFVLAAVAFLAAMAVGVVGLLTGTVRLPHPKQLRDNCLTLPKAQFEYSVLCWAADHFDQNTAAVEWKWRCAWAMLALFFIELALLGWALAN